MSARPAPLRVDARAWIGLVFLSLVWGTSFLFTDLALREIAPAQVVAGRIVVAAIVLNVLRLGRRLPLPRAPASWLRSTSFALTGSVLPFFLISWGQEQVPSGLAGVLMSASPLVTVALAHVLVEEERASGRKLLGLVLGAAGVALLLDPAGLGLGAGAARDVTLRQLAILGGALCYAVNTVLVRRFRGEPALVYGSAVMLIAAPLAVLQAAIGGRGAGGGTLVDWIPVIWLGLVPTAAATLVHYRVVAAAGPTFASLTSYLVPVVALLAGVAFLQEQVHAVTGAALAAIAVGIFLVRSDPSKRPRRPSLLRRERGSSAARAVLRQPLPRRAGRRLLAAEPVLTGGSRRRR